MRSFELKYDLIQQTPIIHFQHNMQGATLRASEVKPKLDRFIIKKLGGFEEVYKANPKWFVEYEKLDPKNYESYEKYEEAEKKQKESIENKPALNYKMRFAPKGMPKVEDPPKYGLYYGNMGVKSEAEKAKYVIGDVLMTIICFDNGLIDEIKNVIRLFFVVHNFGRMQNKGFGSYVIKGIYDGDFVGKALCTAYETKEYYCFNVSSADDAITKIKTLYSVMKSGYNINGKYHRSFLFDYFHTMGIGNEKAYLKKNNVSPWQDDENNPGKRKPVEAPGANREYSSWEHPELYVRAVLGVGEKLEYITGFYKDPRDGKYKPNKEKVQIYIKNDEIERFSSPIFFKVIEGRVYFVGRKINDGIFNKDFTFKVKENKDIDFRKLGIDLGRAPDKISTPKQFDLAEFLEYFYKNYDPYAKGFGIGTKLEKYSVGGGDR